MNFTDRQYIIASELENFRTFHFDLLKQYFRVPDNPPSDHNFISKLANQFQNELSNEEKLRRITRKYLSWFLEYLDGTQDENFDKYTRIPQ